MKIKLSSKAKKTIISVITLVIVLVAQWVIREFFKEDVQIPDVSLEEVPAFSGSPYVHINKSVPFFEESEVKTESYEYYGKLDSLGRCTVTVACVTKDTMPTESREDISSVKPTGWVQNSYDIVEGGVLYNRAHLIGFQLTGQNANRQNLITGTRYMNVQGMLPFENMVADHVKETGHGVMYRVTPIFEEDELVARGVLMESLCTESTCEDACTFCVYVYNVQPGIVIDYATGENHAE